jgi:multidrug efflux pump
MVIFAGVLVSAFLTLFIVPTAYYWLARKTGSPQEISHKLEKLDEQIPYRKGDNY